MSTATLPYRVPKPVSRKVRLLRWMVRGYVCANGLAALLVLVGAAFWLGLALDWSFEPSVRIRVAMWITVGLGAIAVAHKYFFDPLRARLSDTNLALLLERNFPDLGQSLITTVEAASTAATRRLENDSLLSRTSEVAANQIGGKKLREVFKFRPLLLKSALATAAVASVVVFAYSAGDAFGFWIQRMQLSEGLWPRQVELSVIGFKDIDGIATVHVARGDDYSLQVLASAVNGHIVPDQVEVRYRQPDGRRGRFPLTRVGDAVPGRDSAQLFRYDFKNVESDQQFDLVGGDDRLRGLQLRVVERPQIVRMLVECEFPEYLNRLPQTIPFSRSLELPEGTHAVCRLECNKPLQAVRVVDPAEQMEIAAVLDPSDDHQASLHLDVNQVDRVLLITVLDRDGVENKEPYRFSISSIVDQPPEIMVQLRGIGTGVTPQAQIPLAGSVTDEYALRSLWYQYQVDESEPATIPVRPEAAGRRELTDLGAFDLSSSNPATNRPTVELTPGQQLTFALKASDQYNLDQDGNTGSSQRFVLDILTESQLRSLLEKKELALRQRFESIHEKMMGTRELLDRIEIADTHSVDAGASTDGADRRLDRSRLRATGALQNVVQLSYETLGVADGIESIVEELVNNRVDSEEMTERLLAGIAQPLREIGAELMPELEEELQTLHAEYYAETTASDRALDASKGKADAVLAAMQRVLDRMLELESYNELVELLRGIVEDQKQIQEQTKKERKKQLRNLLED